MRSKFDGFEDALRTRNAEERDGAFEEIIRSIPVGKVATYGQVAEAAGHPRGHRLVATFLRTVLADDLPWQRVVGAGGQIKTKGTRQRNLLKVEGVICFKSRIDMELYGHIFA